MPNLDTPASTGRYGGWFRDQVNNVLEAYYRNAAPFMRVTTAQVVTFLGSLLANSPTAGIGYATGAGGTVTQQTDKTTGVTINKVCGQITMDNAALNAGVEVVFTVTNSVVDATDVIIVNHASVGASDDDYIVAVGEVSSGQFGIVVSNASAGNLSEAIVINFAVIKAVSA